MSYADVFVSVVDAETDEDPITISVYEGVAGPTFDGATIGDGTVTDVKLASGAVTTVKLATSSVSTAKIADGAVTAAKTDGSLAKTANNGNDFSSLPALRHNVGLSFISAKDYGAVGDCVQFSDGVMTNGSPNLSCASAPFGSATVGMAVCVANAASGASLYTTIASITDSSHVVLSANCTNASGVTGAKGAFGTDNTTPLVNAIAASRTAKLTLLIPAGSYAVTGQLLNVANQQGGWGFDICGDARGQTKLVKFYDDNTSPLFFIQGKNMGGSVTTTAASVAGQQQLTVTSSTLATADDATWVQLKDTSQPILGLSGATQAYVGEVLRVQSNDDSTHFTLKGALNDAYASGTNVSFWKPVAGIRMRDLDLINPVPLTQRAASRWFQFVACVHIDIERVRGFELDTDCFYFQDCWEGRVVNCSWTDTHDSVNNTPYMIAIKSSTSHFDIDGCFLRNGRHLVTTLTASTPTASCSFIHVQNCLGIETTNSPFDTHPAARYVTFENCHVRNTSVAHVAYLSDGAVTNGIGTAFQIRGADCKVLNCSAVGAFVGLGIYGGDRCVVSNCVFDGCAVGIDISSGNDFQLNNIYIRNPWAAGVCVETDLGGYTNWIQKGYMANVRVDGNPSRTASGATVSVATPAGFLFNYWTNGIYVDFTCRADGATTPVSGMSGTTLASASVLTIPPYAKVINITGNTAITGIKSTPLDAGRLITLVFPASPGTIASSLTAGQAVVLAASPYTPPANSSLFLYNNGSGWLEIGHTGLQSAKLADMSGTAIANFDFNGQRAVNLAAAVAQSDAAILSDAIAQAKAGAGFLTGPAGCKGISFPRNNAMGNIALLTSGVAAAQLITCFKGDVVSNITFLSKTTALAGGNHWWFGLVDAATMTYRAVSADQTSNAWGASTLMSLAMAASYTIPTTAAYYLVCMVNATTAPSLAGIANSTGQPDATAPIYVGTSGSGLTTPPTAGSSTLAALTGAGGTGSPFCYAT